MPGSPVENASMTMPESAPKRIRKAGMLMTFVSAGRWRASHPR
ncbi:hypothetical protein [Pseudorhodoferax sp.]